MKAAVYILMLLAACVCAANADDKKTDKRGVLGLGYGAAGLAPHSYYGHGLGLYSNSLYGHGLYGHGLYGHGGVYGHGLYGAGVAAPLLGHGALAAPLYGGYGAYGGGPLLGLGHPYLH